MAGGESRPIRVLVVDDSAIVRDLLEKGLSKRPGIVVVGKAEDAFSARDQIVYLKPDVVTLDIEMPKMDGIEFLRRLMPQFPLPVIVVSAYSSEGSRRAIEAIDSGAIDIVVKPSGNGTEGFISMLDALSDSIIEAARADTNKIRRAAALRAGAASTAGAAGLAGAESAINGGTAAPRTAKCEPRVHSERVIAIGASTGGTAALHSIIPFFPSDTPGVVIVQHMPAGFTRLFAESLDRSSRLRVKEAEEGETVMRGSAYVAPGDYHIRLSGRPGAFTISLSQEAKVNGHRPSVDVLFSSVARCARDRAVGLILTGMGRDGALGMLEMRQSGARCLAQDEESSIVFGMPKEAFACGAAERFVPLERAAAETLGAAGG
jgi:two-component system, chemotaxis family, protein-glutamate methylesterase/glutaminase